MFDSDPVSAAELQTPGRTALQRFYPWTVIAVAFLTVGVAFGARNAFAVFLIPVLEEFHWSRGLASGALMIGAIMWTLGAPIIGICLDRWGPRLVLPAGASIMALGFVVAGAARNVVQFYVGMGVLMGIGFAALPMTSQATFLANWFVRKRGMAIGIAASGIGFGILLLVPWSQWLITAYGWRPALFILAALLAFVVAPLNFFCQRKTPEEMNLKADFGSRIEVQLPPRANSSGPEGPTVKAALQTACFWLFALGVLAGAIPLHMVLIHQVAAVTDAGFSGQLAAWVLGMIGLFTAPAMIGMGLLADRIGRQRSYVVGSLSLIIGIFLLMSVRDTGQSWMLYAFPPFFAVGFSSRQSLYPTLAADLFHGKSFGAIIGVIALFIGAGAGIGPWLGGVLHDWTGTYLWAFLLAQALALASIVFIWIAGSGSEKRIH
jgi:MFS family permease